MLNLVLDYESSALAAPQSFRDAMQAAANVLDATIYNNITVTVLVGYGDWYNGYDTGITTGAEGGVLNGVYESYASLRAALASHETSALDQTFVNSLPNTASINGVSSFFVPNAEAKALGFVSATASGDDGAVGMGTQIPANLLVGVALHELTHAMGRINYGQPYDSAGDVFDLFRYTSPGNQLFSGASTASPAYFSLDGGHTKLADFGQTSDPSDLLNSGVQGSNDAFNEFYSSSTLQSLSTVDKELLSALGFNVTASDTTNLFGTIVHTVQSTAGQIYALYEGLLARAPDLLGAEGWQSAMQQGVSLHDVTAAFLGSPEGQSHLGAADNATFVQELYQTVLNRSADPAGLQGWTNALNSGMSRADVADGFVFSSEHVAYMQSGLNAGSFIPDPTASDVARLYYGLLGRAPDAGGLATWTNDATHGASLQNVAQSFMNSAEYQNSHAGMTDAQFVNSLYVDALGRNPAAAELQGWTNALANGTSHVNVAIGVAESPEAHLHNLAHIESGWLLA